MNEKQVLSSQEQAIRVFQNIFDSTIHEEVVKTPWAYSDPHDLASVIQDLSERTEKFRCAYSKTYGLHESAFELDIPETYRIGDFPESYIRSEPKIDFDKDLNPHIAVQYSVSFKVINMQTAIFLLADLLSKHDGIQLLYQLHTIPCGRRSAVSALIDSIHSALARIRRMEYVEGNLSREMRVMAALAAAVRTLTQQIHGFAEAAKHGEFHQNQVFEDCGEIFNSAVRLWTNFYGIGDWKSTEVPMVAIHGNWCIFENFMTKDSKLISELTGTEVVIY